MQATGGTQLLRLVENSESRLVVQQAAANAFMRFPLHFVVVVAIGLLVFFAVTRRWSWMLAPGILLVLALVTLRPMPTYKATVDNASRRVSWGSAVGDEASAEVSVSVDDLSAAGLQSGKSGNRVVLVRKDGTQAFPLGTAYFMNEPVQLLLTQHVERLISPGSGQ